MTVGGWEVEEGEGRAVVDIVGREEGVRRWREGSKTEWEGGGNSLRGWREGSMGGREGGRG